MTTKITIFGEIKLVKSNPWLSGKLLSYVKRGLAKVKKQLILASPPPWMGDPEKLSDAQLYQVLRFSKVAHETAGQTMDVRIQRMKAEASGATPYPKKPRVRTPNIGRIITIARARGMQVPAGLPTAPEIVASQREQVSVIRE